MSKVLIYSQEDLDLILELEKEKNEDLQQENKILKENAEHNDKVVDKVNWENQLLKKENKQLKIQISAREEVCNRLEDNWNNLNKKYENAVADYEKTMFEKEQLKKQLEELKSTNKVLSEELTKDKILKQDCLTTCCGIPIGDIPKLITQQKEFIEYMNDIIEDLETEDVDDEEMKGYLIQRIDIFKEILQKYKSIIGDDK